MRAAKVLIVGSLTLLLSACGDTAQLPEDASIGPNPPLPPPAKELIPTVNIAPAKGWPEGAKPTPASELSVTAFATGLDHPRWLYVLPNGDVLVAETNAPPRAEEGRGIKGWIYQTEQKRAGAGVPSANRIMLLRDTDGDGVAETKKVFLKDLHSPFGMAVVGKDFYVANADAVMRFAYEDGATAITTPGAKLADLPGGPINHHWTRQSRRLAPLCHRRLQQQRGRERHRQGGAPRRHSGDRSRQRTVARVRLRPAQSQRHGLAGRHAVDGGE